MDKASFIHSNKNYILKYRAKAGPVTQQLKEFYKGAPISSQTVVVHEHSDRGQIGARESGRGRLDAVAHVAAEQSCDAGSHEAGEAAGDHRAHGQLRQVGAPFGRHGADAAQLDADRAQVREAAQRVCRNQPRTTLKLKMNCNGSNSLGVKIL